MKKTRLKVIAAVLILIFSGPSVCPAETSALGAGDYEYLTRIEKAVFQGFEKMRDPATGFPVDVAPVSQGKILKLPRSTQYSKTSPMHIAFAFLYTVLARDRGYLSPQKARRQAFYMMEIVENLETYENFLYSWYYLPGEAERWPRVTGNRQISPMENAYLDAALMVTASAFDDKGLRDMIADFLSRRDYSFFYTEDETFGPSMKTGYDVKEKRYSKQGYRTLNHGARLLLLTAVIKGDVPKTVWTTQERLVKYYQTQNSENIPVVVSWAGTLYETLLADEILGGHRVSPASFGLNALNTIRVHQDRGGRISETGIWGFSEGEVPDQNRYLISGVPEIAYQRFEGRFATPYSSFLALSYAPQAAIDNLKKMEELNPSVFGSNYGFTDSIDPATGVVNRNILGVHKGIEMLALANYRNRLAGEPEISRYFWKYLKEMKLDKAGLSLLKNEELQPSFKQLVRGKSESLPVSSTGEARFLDLIANHRDIGTFYDPGQAKAWHEILSLKEGTKVIGIRYDVRRKYTYSGLYMKLNQTDLTPYHYLRFKIRGSSEKGYPANLKVELKWRGQNVQFDYITLKDGWMEVALPLPEGAKKVDEIAFVFDNAEVGPARRGEVFIQSLAFN